MAISFNIRNYRIFAIDESMQLYNFSTKISNFLKRKFCKFSEAHFLHLDFSVLSNLKNDKIINRTCIIIIMYEIVRKI